MNRLVHTLQICLLGSLCAYAQTPPEALKSMVPDPGEVSRKGDMARMAQKKSEERFDAADDDKDGFLSRAEVARHLPYFDANFERYDKDGNGLLSWDEFVGHDKWKRPAR